MKITPQLRLTLGLVALLLSTVFIADLIGLLPRPEEQIRQSRKVLGESLAVQLSSAVSNGGIELIQTTLQEIVQRNDDVVYSGLFREDERILASFGENQSDANAIFDRSSFDNLVIPIFQNDTRWGEARLTFSPTLDWGLRYLGIAADTLIFAFFLGTACLISFHLFMRKALVELNPTKAVPERVNSAFNVLAEGVWILDEKERIVLANRAIAGRLGRTPEQMVGQNPMSFDWDLSGDDLEELPWQSAMRRHEHITGMPLKIQVEDQQIAFTVNAAPIDDGQGMQKGVLVTFDDVTPLEKKNTELATMLAQLNITQQVIEDKNKELEVLATRDSLTGCLNRRSFIETYSEQYHEAEKSGMSLCVLMLDIDHFKLVNDTHGHGVGDRVIQVVAKILNSTFGRNESVGRYGGEEFVVSLPGYDVDTAMGIANDVRLAVTGLTASGDIPLEVLTVSIGVASYSQDVPSHTALVDLADRALYQAKQTGRNRACLYNPSYADSADRKQIKVESSDDGSTGKTAMVRTLKSQLQNMHQLVQRQANEITHKSMHDEITGLPNRFLLQDRLAQAMKLSDRNNNITAIVSISLSAYQKITSMLGRDAAENMIRGAAHRVETVVRSIDAIGVAFNEQALTFSRIADNELAVLVVDLDTVESVSKIIGRVSRALQSTFKVNDHEFENDVYCGIALYPHDGREAELLIRNASLARSFAERRSPRSESAYFSRDIDTQAAKNAGMAAELRKAINENGLEVVYQPKVDSVTNRVTGAEALARWNHPEFGDVGPTEFITIAENIGVIDQLTNWVLSRVCDDISDGKLDGLRVSVNVSPLELYDPDAADRILGIIRQKGVSPHQLEIEITESSILNNFELARTILAKLQNEGLLIVLDDFGTAYSSLNLLIEIPVDVIKVDRCFVSDLHNARDNRAVVRAIIQMARAMGKRVVAEGVETIRERDCLIRLGCREMQGFFYSTPRAFDDLQAYVEQNGILDMSNLATITMLEKTA